MILRNKEGRERNFKVLFQIEKNNDVYLVYEDYITGKCYVGLKNNDKLEKVTDKDIEFINNILEKVSEE